LASSLLGINFASAQKAIMQTRLIARWQAISKNPLIICDCAHNPNAMRAILPQLKKDFSYSKDSPRILLYTSVKEKDHKRCLKTLLPFFDIIILCQLKIPRAQSMQILYSCAKKLAPNKKIFRIKSPTAALSFAKKTASKRGRILIAGSIYMLQELFCSDCAHISG
jgi:dihydrofolate synthase/folylpolyglutamate synthase